MLRDARILVAEDDPDMLDALTDAFERLGALVTRAASGAELIERLADEGPFSLVVTDVSMPWLSGLAAIRSARLEGLGSPVIVMTALRDEGIAAKVSALGEDVVLLRKPFELADLEAAASRLLRSSSAEEAPAPPRDPPRAR